MYPHALVALINVQPVQQMLHSAILVLAIDKHLQHVYVQLAFMIMGLQLVVWPVLPNVQLVKPMLKIV